MAISELIVRISGDNKDIIDKLDKLNSQSEELQNTLSGISKAGAIGFAAFTGAILGSVAAFAESEKAIKQQEAVLKSTGFAAGLTGQQLNDMANRLGDATTAGDDLVRAGQNILLTFQNIGGEAFEPALQAALDLSTALGTDLTSASTLVGKALNDPINGLSALSRVGVQFTEQQREQITVLAESGNVLGAQEAILARLTSSFGGSAAAVAQGTGVFAQLKNTLGDVIEGIGKELAPVLVSAAGTLNTFLKSLRDNQAALRSLAAFLVQGAGFTALIASAAGAALAFIKLRNVVEVFGPKVIAATSAVFQFNLTLIQAAGQAIASFVTAMVRAGASTFGFITNIGSATKAALAFATTALANSLTSLKLFATNMRSATSASGSFFATLGGNAIAALRSLPSLLFNAGNGARIMAAGMQVARVAAKLLAGALTLGIGLILPELIALIQEFVQDSIANFRRATTEITNAFKNLGTNLLNIGSKIGEFLKNLFTFNFGEIKSSAQAVKDAVTKAIDQTFSDVQLVKQKIEIEKTKENKAAGGGAADEEAALAEAGLARQRALQKQGVADKLSAEAEKTRITGEQAKIRNEIIQLTEQGASAERIRIKEEELQLLEQLEAAKTADELALAEARLTQFRATSEKRRQEAIAQEILQREEKKALEEEFAALDEEQRVLAQEKNLENLTAEQLQQREAIIQFATAQRDEKKKSRDAQLKDEVQYGKSFAAINAALNSTQIQGAKSLSSELIQLQQSRNSTLKGIGKAAAITQILIDGAQSATAVFRGAVSTFPPPAGPAIGAALAGASIAFAAEKANQVRSAQEGGIVEGFGRGDRIPTLLEAGEIVVPRPLAPTFEQQFSLSPDNTSAARRTEIQIGTIIGTEEFVKSNIIPAIRDARELDNANLGA